MKHIDERVEQNLLVISEKQKLAAPFEIDLLLANFKIACVEKRQNTLTSL